MITVEQWAKAQIVAEKLFGRRGDRLFKERDVRSVVEELTENTILCGGPRECFSQKMPFYKPAPGEPDLLPIDVVYGSYAPSTHVITIFIKNIKRDAKLFGSDGEDLVTVVRLHEYAHALVHAGVEVGDVGRHLGEMAPTGLTDWERFTQERTEQFNGIPEPVHELLAQAITWGCITGEPMRAHSKDLMNTFNELEKKQRESYQLSPSIKECAHLADWGRVIRRVRVVSKEDLSELGIANMREAVEKLILLSAQK